MSKLYLISKNKETAPDKKLGDTWVRGKRFYTSTDMSIIKHDQAVHNSQIKRGEIDKKGSYSINLSLWMWTRRMFYTYRA